MKMTLMKENEDTIGSSGIIGGPAPWPLPKYTKIKQNNKHLVDRVT